MKFFLLKYRIKQVANCLHSGLPAIAQDYKNVLYPHRNVNIDLWGH